MGKINLGQLRRIAQTAQARERFVAGCSGKIRYESAEAARSAKAEFNNPRLTPYTCESCGGFHLTSHPKQRRKR